MASSGVTQSIESLFGPPSEQINIASFIKDAQQLLLSGSAQASPEQNSDVDMDIEQECSVSDIKEELERILDDPLFSGQLAKDHEQMVGALYANFARSRKPGKKPMLPDPENVKPEVLALQRELDAVPLKSWTLNTQSVMFIRPPRNADYNSFDCLRPTPEGAAVTGSSEAILTISLYNRVLWGPSYATRICQHAYLASQTLQDVYEMLPCIYKANPGDNPAGMSPGCTICIENMLYSDTAAYSNQVLGHFASAKRAPTARPAVAHTAMGETKLASLSLRLHLPYQILHAGNCEHFMVVEEIRLYHSSDPVTGYPIVLQLTPPLSSLCYACHKVSATLSVAGDVRLGESPSLLCGPCWTALGESRDEEVIVTPLPL
ncbi:snRNA-activating protein of 50kDa MW C terminal-domain-containing protein [Ephemerocybe angulata]|uniref:snRNA-activating protein of 50kDa MW C terminal-domain-containing protein n=1 Tax=Ephemerocybe angulata TaxID=980116 RepID=A0A8H6MAM3_9AGAR|nr:snRNA-activating protein of 50kDa MW C terminal-domain-containing protein [Tulosesus angulatus]